MNFDLPAAKAVSIGIVLFISSAATPAQAPLPDGTPVRLVLKAPVSSATANIGDSINLVAVDDVVADGKVVIAKSAEGKAKVTNVRRKGAFGKGGQLAIVAISVREVSGGTIRLRSIQQRGKGATASGKMGAAVASTAAIGVVAVPLFLRKGKDVTFPAGYEILAYVDVDDAEPAVKPAPRVFVADSNSWEVSASPASISGGARPQTAEIIKTMREQCLQAQIVLRRDDAHFILSLEHEGGKALAQRDNKYALFTRSGQAIASGSTRTLGNAVNAACAALTEYWTVTGTSVNPEQERKSATLTVNSSPPGAEILLNGKYVGDTPAELELRLGDHELTLSKEGYLPWKRVLTLTAAKTNVSPQLKKQE